jgi:hypothetical protein
MLQCWPLGCPFVRRCPSECIEAEPHYVVVKAAARGRAGLFTWDTWRFF